MSKDKIYFRGFLTNTDSSILKINLDCGFKIEEISEEEGIRFISNLQNRPYIEIFNELSLDFPIINNSEKKCYFISNSFEYNVGMNDEIRNRHIEVNKFETTYVRDYITHIIQLMRLFKEGNIYMPMLFYYYIENDIPILFEYFLEGNYYSSQQRFSLEDSEISDFQIFIQKIKLPFKEPFLQLAFENFELSYFIHTPNLTFLSLMITVEILFNSGEQELSHRISRSAAVLLGKNFEESRTIYKNFKKLYAIRSKIVHGSEKLKIVEYEDIVKLRNYVRESITEIYLNGKSKDDLLEFLVSQGYGSRYNESKR